MVNKIEWINSLKAVGIFAVILGHIASPFGPFIFSWHMPLFFFLAGFFIQTTISTNFFLNKNFKRLMIPYFLFIFLGILTDTIKRLLLDRENLDYLHEFIGAFLWMDLPSLINTYAFVLWFLPALFFAKLFLFIVIKYVKNMYFQFLVIISLFLLSFYIDLPFGIDNAFNSIIWLYIGHIYYKNITKLNYIYILIPIIALLYYTYGVPKLDLGYKKYENIVLNIIWAVSIIIFMIEVLKRMSLPLWLGKWGEYTMLIFILHPYTNNIGSVLVKKLHFGDWYLSLFVSLILLQIIIYTKTKYNNKGIFRYV